MFGRDFLIGAVAGSVISLAVALSFRDGDATVSELGVGSDRPGATAPPQPASDPAPSAVSSPAQLASARPVTEPHAPQRSAPGALASVDRRQSAEPASPAISTEHAKLLFRAPNEREAITLPELHARFSTEPKDANWAHEAEMQLRSFLAEAGVESGFEIMSVECRVSLCEILAFGNASGSQDRWNAIGVEMTKQPWWTNFRGSATSSSEKNGRTVIATILHRARQ